MQEKERDEGVKEKSEEVLENLESLEKRQKIRKILVIAIISVLFVVIIILGFSFYLYFQSPEKKIGLGANIESALLNSDGKLVYVKLLGGSLDKNITKIKFIFSDENGNEYNYETNEGTQEIEVPFKKSFWDWLFGRQFIGNYDYEIGSDEAGLIDFSNINKVSVLFEYKTETGDVIETPVLDTQRTTNRTTTSSEDDDGDDDGGDDGTTPTPEPTPTCTNDTGCTVVGNFCSGNIPYNCSLNISGGCLDRVNKSECSVGEQCILGSCQIVSGNFYFTNEDTSINITLNSFITGNWARITSPAYGTAQNKSSLTIINFINLTYKPNANYNGEDYFIYNVTDGTNVEVIRVDVTIVPVDDAPILMTESYKTITNIVFGVNSTPIEKSYKLLITEVDGDSLNYSSPNLPSGATLDPRKGVLKWTVSSANIGDYTNIIFSVTDLTSAGLSDTKIVNITIRLAQTYYCDPISGNTATGDGSAGNPWGTLQSVGEAGYFNEIKIKSGDTIKLRDGYHGQLSIWKKANTDYITVESDEGVVANLSNIILKYTDYWYFKGLKMSPELAVPSRVNPGNQSSMFSGYSNRFIKVENCIMYTIDNASSWMANEWSNLSWSGISLSYTTNSIARNNIIRNVRSGISLGTLIIIENNTVDGFSGDGMYVAADSILQDNIIINKHDPADGFHNDGIQGWGNATKNITVRRNYINARTDPNRNDNTVGGLQGIFLTGNVSGIIENNVVLAKNAVWGIGISSGSFNLYILNNTIMRPYNIGYWPDIHIGYFENSIVKNNIADVIPVANITRNITSENNLKITNYNETQISSFFVNYPYGDVRPLITSPMCNGSINPVGVAVGALPCVCTNDLQCEEVFGVGATCDINTGKCVGGTGMGSLSPFTQLLNFLKGLLTKETGKAILTGKTITGNAVNENGSSDYEKLLIIFIGLIILFFLIIIVLRFAKVEKKRNKRR